MRRRAETFAFYAGLGSYSFWAQGGNPVLVGALLINDQIHVVLETDIEEAQAVAINIEVSSAYGTETTLPDSHQVIGRAAVVLWGTSPAIVVVSIQPPPGGSV